MASLNVNPEYDIDMEQLTPETRAHADRFNERYEQLLGNDAFLKGKLEDANTSIERAMAVAQGKSAGLVFNTYAELIAYIAVSANAEKFRLGDQFLIKAMNVPDYWWDNTVTTEQTDIEGNVISAKNSSGKVIGALVELEARKVDLSKYDENDAALFDNMSDQYSASRTYDVGDICIYDNDLYKCVTAVEIAETFDQAKWNKTSFAALHADQEKRISENTQSLDNCLKSVSDGKSTVASAITAQGVSTAADAEFATMATNIASAGTNKYNAGRRQGRADVTAAPNSYSLYTSAQYASYGTQRYNNGYNAGVVAGKNAVPSFDGYTDNDVTFDFNNITSVYIRSGSFTMYGSNSLTSGFTGQGSYSGPITITKSTSGYRYIKLSGAISFNISPKK